MVTKEQALAYHSEGRRGKIEVVPSKPTATQRELSLAYTPGVAEPCREIAKNPDDVYKYTAKGNLVAVVTNGTAVLGLGNLGPLGAKPVMEGKAVLFKRFADVDAFDIELATNDVDEFVRTCQILEPTFGGINLEDVKAPECFEIERRLVETLQIPVFHDDQHGTAIISAAAFLNAVHLVGKKLEDVKVVFLGAGAAGIACAKLYLDLGVRPENVLLVDSKGVIHDERTDLTSEKRSFARKTSARSLADAMRGADAFIGVATANLVSGEMVKSMAARPIVFAMANPDPEITPDAVRAVRPDAIIATGRSDYPNQVNNALGFPFIFRGALDVRARKITEAMKQAAVHALASIARRSDDDIPAAVRAAYPGESIVFGPEYIIPKPFDPRVLIEVAPAVAEAAMASGVAREIIDLAAYRRALRDKVEKIAVEQAPAFAVDAAHAG